jgi:superfamily II DNA or RNA helicase
VTVARDGDEIVVTPPFPDSKEYGARWDAGRGVFALPASRGNAHMVADRFGVAPDDIVPLGPSSDLLGPVSAAANAAMYPHQRTIAARIAAAPRGALVVVPPGQGKTLLSIAAADSLGPCRVLVVCPASLIEKWWREIDRWGSGAAEWTVESWDVTARLARFDSGRRGGGVGSWDLVILDESVMGKSRKAQRFKSFKKVTKYWDRVWLLSGNPMSRYADDLWAQLSLIWPRAYPSYWRFARRYCVIEETPWGDKVVGTRPNRDVMEENDDLVIVVGQEDLVELPEYRFETMDVVLGPGQRAAFDAMAEEFVAELEDGSQVVAENEISKLVRLQQITSYWDGESAKHDALLQNLDDYEEPHLVWTHWREGAEALWTRLVQAGASAAWVSGTDSLRDRDQTMEDYKAGLVDVLVLSIGVGKFGHDFVNTRTVHYVDKTWNADDYFQSLRRVRRIGLDHRPTVVTYRAPGTTDELVEMNLEGKLGGISRLTRSDLAELLRGLGKEEQ